jgi:ketosteroid isomerase-like protein
MKGPLTIFLVSLVIIAGCVSDRQPRANSDLEREVRTVLEKQLAAWNAGDLPWFLETYARSASPRFASGGDVSLGWQTVFDRYQRKYGGKETMGELKFSDVDIQVLGRESALAFGRWHLTREGGATSGLYTLVLRKTRNGWRIVHDHTSSASP